MMMRVLVVDDDRSQRVIISRLLESDDLEIDLADGVEQGLELIRNKKYGLIITDKVMPLDGENSDQAGMKIIQYAKEKQPYARIVMMTAYDEIQTAVAAMKAGIIDYLVKPVDKVRLNKLVEKVFSYNSFINKDGVLDLYKEFNTDVLNLFENLTKCDDESKHILVKWMDEKIFKFLIAQKKWEKVILEQRDSLQDVSRYSEELRERVGEDDELYKTIEKISLASEKRV